MAERVLARPFGRPVGATDAFALLLLAAILVMAALGPWIVPYDPLATDPPAALQPPSRAHLFGTDQLGRDVFSRVVVAARVDLGIALIAVAATLILGTALGAAAGWAGGWTDRIVSRFLDTIMAFPLFVLAVGIAAGLGNSVSSIVIATVVVNLPLYARLVRAEVNRRRHAGYVEAARLAGAGPFSLVAVHIMPNVAPPLMVLASLNMGWAILNAAGLSFLGLGIRPPQPEWGIMVSEGAGYIISGEWWLFAFPGGMLFLAILCFSLLGDTLREWLDPEAAMNMPVTVAPLVALRRLRIGFGPSARPPVVDGVDLDIGRGETVALVGESGSGKSLVAHTIAGIVTKAARVRADRFEIGGVDLRAMPERTWRTLRGREIGIVFQNPRAALNPVRTIGRQIADVIHEHRGLSGASLNEAVSGALSAVRIPEPALRRNACPGELSGGMCQRVMIAIALAGNPSLLIADEPTTGLDTTTQAAILDLILGHAAERRMATLLITHDLGLARAYADRIVVMHAGQIAEQAAAEALFAAPRHPYSAALIGATANDAQSVADLVGIPGSLPDLDAGPPACRFAGRCNRVTDRCIAEPPPFVFDVSRHGVACWRPL